MSQTTTKIMTVTPPMAQAWLAMNTQNRAIRIGWVRFLARELKDGGWLLTSDAVAFDTDGVLLNGQHRLMAIVLANKPAELSVMENLPVRNATVIDNGVKRTQADNLKLRQELVSDANLISFRFARNLGGRVSNQDVEDIKAWWGPAFNTLMSTPGLRTQTKPSVGARLGFGLRWAISPRHERDYVLQQFAAYVCKDNPNMSRAISAIYARAVGKKEWHSSHAGRFALMNALFYASDYQRRLVEPQFRQVDILAIEVEQWFRLMKDAWIAGPTKDEHPYLFMSRPAILKRENRPAPARSSAQTSLFDAPSP